MAADRGSFGRFGFVLAAIGSAIGLGNIWKFPYITYANEGGSFVLVYLVAVALIGAPIMFAEILIGRRTQQSAFPALAKLGEDVPGGRSWAGVGLLGISAAFLLLSYYAVIAGWTIYYFGRCMAWSLRGFELEGAELAAVFGGFLANGPLQILFHGLFLAVTVAVVTLGIKGGIERATKILMPILGAILLLLVINSIRTPGFGEAMRFLFHIGPIEADGFLEAVGHAFFTLSLGIGGMITYGSYVGKDISIPRSALVICVADTLIALVACIVMFSIIFSVPVAERATTFGRSATILFTTLPRMFYEMPLGAILSPLFYMSVAFAALTSTIALLEVVVAFLIDARGWARRKAALAAGAAIFATGIPAALSLGASSTLTNWAPLGQGTAGVFSVFDYAVSNWMLPVGGLLTAVFAGWFVKPSVAREELEIGHGPLPAFGLWRFLLRFVAPIAILWIVWAVIGGRSFA